MKKKTATKNSMRKQWVTIGMCVPLKMIIYKDNTQKNYHKLNECYITKLKIATRTALFNVLFLQAPTNCAL